MEEVTLLAESRMHGLEDLLDEILLAGSTPVYEDETAEMNELAADLMSLLVELESRAGQVLREVAKKHKINREV